MSAQQDKDPVVERLQELDPEAIEGIQMFRGETTLFIRPDHMLRACQFLREAPGLSFKYLSDVTAVDNLPNDPRFEVVYHLLALEPYRRVRLKVRISAAHPRVASVISVWPAANAFEREVFDLFGIHFEGHPYLRRILLPDDWEGHPLRKDYPTEGFR